MKKHIFLTVLILGNMITLFGQYQDLYTTIPNYIKTDNTEATTSTAGTLRVEKVSIPQYQYFRVAADRKKRPCVIICPGGGYSRLAIQHEGTDVAAYFNSIGVNAIVLKYRIPNSASQENKSIAPLQDAQQAIYLARINAKVWGIDPHKIGIMGFSAGGHLASLMGTSHNNNLKNLYFANSYRPFKYKAVGG